MRRRPRMVATRVTDTEKAIIEAVAADAGLTVSELLYRQIVSVILKKAMVSALDSMTTREQRL